MSVTLVSPGDAAEPGRSDLPWSWPLFLTFRRQQQAYEAIGIYSDTEMNLGDGDPERITGAEVNATFLPVLGVTPALGTNFPAEYDNGPNGPRRYIDELHCFVPEPEALPLSEMTLPTRGR
jgi:hypothetical protein